MVAKPPTRKTRAVQDERRGEGGHSHGWVVDLTTGRVTRGDCPVCCEEQPAADSPRE